MRWTLSSEPAGAEVIDAQAGTSLGTTPWFREQAAQPGKRNLIVRAAGYTDVPLELDQQQDVSPHIRLSRMTTTDLGANGSVADASAAGSTAPPQTAATDLGTGSPNQAATKPNVNTLKTPTGPPRLPGFVPPKKKTGPNGSGNLRDEEIPTALPDND